MAMVADYKTAVPEADGRAPPPPENSRAGPEPAFSPKGGSQGAALLLLRGLAPQRPTLRRSKSLAALRRRYVRKPPQKNKRAAPNSFPAARSSRLC